MGKMFARTYKKYPPKVKICLFAKKYTIFAKRFIRRCFRNVKVDTETLRFYAEREICGKKEYGVKVSILCRSVRTLARCEKGKANKLSQTLYNHTKTNSTQLIAIKLNQCRHCYKWVCNNCYDNSDTLGICSKCSETEKRGANICDLKMQNKRRKD